MYLISQCETMTRDEIIGYPIIVITDIDPNCNNKISLPIKRQNICCKKR